MAARRIYLVGEPFECFADGDRVTTPKRLSADMEARGNGADSGVELLPGQGLLEADYAELSQEVAHHCRPRDLRASSQWRESVPATIGTYKDNVANVLVSDLRQSGDKEFTAELVIHPHNVMLIDRDNGARHVAGMLEVEACLQMAMAVTAQYLSPPGSEYAFVTSTTTINFLAFLFPLPATLTLLVNGMGDADGKYLELDLLTTISQSGRPTMTMEFRSRAFDVAVLRATERSQLDRALAFGPDETDDPSI
ncbi:AfsA-related hotdog domain-containing protein [Phytomonospora sp. NPDC050363]|uniref:AfsA-related hotdog domain-containing protein n=1 Tax=Phytomonospora sp. NPDC050363 TaxID=3155642 RepID=UPI0033CF17C6